MYKGIPFSPQVALADSIGASDTVIKVTDITAFPDAPNYATIGTDETGETIMYAAKTADSLSGCTRGIEGTASSWPAGTTIARNFTNKDFEAMQENIRANQTAAENAKNTANGAATAAGNAQQTAENAQTTAREAKSIAGTAQTAAENARKDALLKSGGTMTGPIAMGGNKVTGLGTPTASGDAVPKSYADTIKAVPSSTTADNGKFLRVVSGAAAWQTVQAAEEVSV